MKITRVESDHLRIPLHRPVAMPTSQDPRIAKELDVVIVRIHSDKQLEGLGYTYSLGGGGAAIRSIIDSLIAPLILGEDPTLIERLFLRAQHELETLGFAGLAARSYAAVDFALWDLKGKSARLPVYKLLGGYRTKLKAIVSDTATPALGTRAAIKETRAALDAGAAGLIVEIGTADPDIDADRLRQLREAVPDGAWFEVSACSRYDFSTALWMARMCEEEFAIDGFSDPLRTDNLDGLKRLLDRLEVAISVGALVDRIDDFQRILNQGGLSSIRIDPVRLGGLTPSRKVAQLAELNHVAICPVRSPEIGTQLAAGCILGRVCETVDWLTELFSGGPRFHDGQYVVSDQPGLGFQLNEAFASKVRI